MTRTAATYGAAAVAGQTGKLPTPYPRTMGPRVREYVEEVIAGGLTSADMITRFETTFAEAMGVAHCIGTSGCTPALAALAAAVDFQRGDEIIVSPITDYGSLQGMLTEGYIPVFADTAPGDINLSARTVEACISDRTRAVLVVHKTGLVCDMQGIMALAERHGLMVIEDACQAVYSRRQGRLAGTVGHAGAFSFDSEKTMGSDQGGCLITDDADLAERVRYMGISRGAYQEPGFGRVHSDRGYAYRMPYCTAAVTLGQFEIVQENVRQRDEMARYLMSLLAMIPGVRPLTIPPDQDVYSCWMMGLHIEPSAFRCDTDTFAAELAAAGIPGAGTGRYYLMPASLHFLQRQAREQTEAFSPACTAKRYHYDADATPNARDVLRTFIRWSSFCEKYSRADCERAAEIVATVAERNRT